MTHVSLGGCGLGALDRSGGDRYMNSKSAQKR